ncbi:hypothetical protein H072_9301 [Dactylellina haptotyla CBS 200.50]|uniref:HMG box domain-containing protein n=1 Tax=Dactylellina haptotyla (strain CBS 200.50) TaxID=1284197 RepID=S8BPE3_DACHA|nr:hypothetical protein H072_9301 [Dactylellina haptotyla CBS 200.50]
MNLTISPPLEASGLTIKAGLFRRNENIVDILGLMKTHRRSLPPHVREELKGQNLSFTEIARLVGERWKVLDPDQKEEYEYQATTMKERYNQELAAYKKTDNYKEYSHYLLEFKTKEAAKEAGEASFTPTPDVPRKRPKLESIPSQGSTHSSLPGSSTASIGSAGGPTAVTNTSRGHQQQHPGESPGYPQPATIAGGHFGQHGRRESYASPFTQPSTPASQMVSPVAFSESSGSSHAMRQYPSGTASSSYDREAVTLPFRDSPGRSTHMQSYDQPRASHGGGHAEGFEPGIMHLPKINAQPHIQQVLSFSRGQQSPGDSPSQHPRRSGSISGMSYQHQQQRPALHSSDTLSTQNSMSSSGSSSVPSLTPATPSDGDGRQIHGHSLRALPPLRNPSPSQRDRTSSSYFPQRPSREVSGGGGVKAGGYTGGHGSTSSSPRSQLPSLVEQTMQDQPPRRGGEGADQA